MPPRSSHWLSNGPPPLLAGTRGAGKTTMLGALLWELSPTVRVVLVEDTPELPVDALQAAGRDVQSLRTNGGDGPGFRQRRRCERASRLGEGALVVGEVRGEEAAVLYEAMRVGANGSAVLGTIHGDGGERVRERVVSDLGVPESSFATTDLVVTLEPYDDGGDRRRRVASIEAVVDGDAGVRFAPLFALENGELRQTGRIEGEQSSRSVPDRVGRDVRTVPEYAGRTRAFDPGGIRRPRRTDVGRTDGRRPVLSRVLESIDARRWPGPVSVDDDLDRALAFVGADVDGETVHRASYAAAVGLAVVGFVVTTATRVHRSSPRRSWRSQRASQSAGRSYRSLSRGPNGRVPWGLPLRSSPGRRCRWNWRRRPNERRSSLPRLVEGTLASSLEAHVRRSAAGPATGFSGFVAEWKPWFPELERACSLVESAGTVPADQRSATLERARSTVLNATRDRMADFAGSIRGPATAVYAFGVLLPLALVSLLPGAPRCWPSRTASGRRRRLRCLATALCLLGASAWLLARRPVAFPPTTVERSHPDVPARRWPGPVVGFLAAALSWWCVPLVFPPWATPVAVAGAGAGTALVVHYRPVVQVRRSVGAVEDGLSDALALLGRRVERGESVESAVAGVADDVPGPTSELLDAGRSAPATARRRRGDGLLRPERRSRSDSKRPSAQ